MTDRGTVEVESKDVDCVCAKFAGAKKEKRVENNKKEREFITKAKKQIDFS